MTPIRVTSWLLLLAFCGGLFFWKLGDRDLWSAHEGRAAMDAQTLLEDGFDQMPRLYDGRPELQKPPLYYWLVAAFGRLRGGEVDAWCVRLPAALAGLVGVLTLFELMHRRGRPLAGFLAAAVLASAVHYTWISRTGRTDVPLAATTALALAAFFLVRTHGPSIPLQLVGYLAVALGVLLKGPLGAVLPAAVAGSWLLLDRPRTLRGLGLWWGAPLVALIVIPCYAWAHAATDGEFTRVFLWHHNVSRGFGGSDVLRGHPWWFYAPRFAVDFLPWTPLVAVAGWVFLRRTEDREARFGLLWFAVLFVLMSLMRFKRSDYLLPAFPGAALAVGCLAERWYLAAARPRRWAATFASIMAACVLGWAVYLEHDLEAREPEREYTRFAAEVRRHVPEPRPVLLFRTEAHALAFRLGRPLSVFVEWERLDQWAAGDEAAYVVMPAAVARDWPHFLRSGCLEEVVRNTDLDGSAGHEKPLVLLRTRPGPAAP